MDCLRILKALLLKRRCRHRRQEGAPVAALVAGVLEVKGAGEGSEGDSGKRTVALFRPLGRMK